MSSCTRNGRKYFRYPITPWEGWEGFVLETILITLIEWKLDSVSFNQLNFVTHKLGFGHWTKARFLWHRLRSAGIYWTLNKFEYWTKARFVFWTKARFHDHQRETVGIYWALWMDQISCILIRNVEHRF